MNIRYFLALTIFISASSILAMDFGALYRQATKEIEEKVPAGQVILVSQDGKEFELPQNIAEQSQTLKGMIEDIGADRKIPIDTISSQTLEEIVNLLNALHKHQNLANKALLDAVENEVKITDFFALLSAANYLDINPIITLASRSIAKELALTAKDISQKTTDKIVQKVKERKLLESIFHQYYLLTGNKISRFPESVFNMTPQEAQDYPVQNQIALPYPFPTKPLALMAGSALASTLLKPKKEMPGPGHLGVETISLITEGKEFHVPLEVALESSVIKNLYQNSLMNSFDLTGIGISAQRLELISDVMWALEKFKYLQYRNLVEAVARHSSKAKDAEELLATGVQLRFKPAIILAAYWGNDKTLSNAFQTMSKVLSLNKNKTPIQVKQELKELGYSDLARYYYIFHKSKLSGVNPKDYGLSIQDYLNYSPEDLERSVIHTLYGNPVIPEVNQSFTVIAQGRYNAIIKYDNSLNLQDLYLNSLDGLSNIPKIETIRYLDLSENNLSDLESNHFLKMGRLIQLDLQNNTIKAIQGENTFKGASNLEILNLGGNDIVNLNPTIFKSLPNLKRLNVDRKKLDKTSFEFIRNFKPYLKEGKRRREDAIFWSRL